MKKKTVKQILEEIDLIKKTKKITNREAQLEKMLLTRLDWIYSNTWEMLSCLQQQNKILSKNTFYTGGGFLVGGVALIISLIALIK